MIISKKKGERDEMITIDGREVFTTLEELVNPKYTALLLIDIQNDFCSPGGHVDDVGVDMSMLQQVPSRVKPVLETARRCGVLVVHIQHTCYPSHIVESSPWLRGLYKIKSTMQPEPKEMTEESATLLLGGTLEGTWGWQVADEIAAQRSEIIIRKHRASAFIGTDLDMILRTNGIKSVVSVGVVTEGCVALTAWSAYLLDYYSIVLRDCIGSATPEAHEAALLLMSNRLDVVESSEVVKLWV